MPNGDYLSLTIWPGKSGPAAEILTVQVRHQSSDDWETVTRLAVYRTIDGKYSQLPGRDALTLSHVVDLVKTAKVRNHSYGQENLDYVSMGIG
jgi:hypothetical protein